MPDTHILDAFETLHGPQDWNQPHHCHVHGTHGWCEPCQAAIDHAANQHDDDVSDSEAEVLQQRADKVTTDLWFGGAA